MRDHPVHVLRFSLSSKRKEGRKEGNVKTGVSPLIGCTSDALLPFGKVERPRFNSWLCPVKRAGKEVRRFPAFVCR